MENDSIGGDFSMNLLIKSALSEYDTDKDGKLDAKELSGISDGKGQDLVSKFDGKGGAEDGKLSGSELINALLYLAGKEGRSAPVIEDGEAFDKNNADGDGGIDSSEIKGYMQDRGISTDKSLGALIDEYDEDGDGMLDTKELVAMEEGEGGASSGAPSFDEANTDGLGGIDTAELKELIDSSGLNISAGALLDKYDADGSGELEAGEYNKMVAGESLGKGQSEGTEGGGEGGGENPGNSYLDETFARYGGDEGSMNKEQFGKMIDELGIDVDSDALFDKIAGEDGEISKQDMNDALIGMSGDNKGDADLFTLSDAITPGMSYLARTMDQFGGGDDQMDRGEFSQMVKEASPDMSDEQIDAMFDKYDVDGESDGMLSRAELGQALLENEEIRPNVTTGGAFDVLFGVTDQDNDDGVSLEEFKDMPGPNLNDMGTDGKSEEANDAYREGVFDSFDEDGNGKLDEVEFGKYQQAELGVKVDMSPEELFSVLDQDSSGTLDGTEMPESLVEQYGDENGSMSGDAFKSMYENIMKGSV